MEAVSMDRLRETPFIPCFLWQKMVNCFRFKKTGIFNENGSSLRREREIFNKRSLAYYLLYIIA